MKCEHSSAIKFNYNVSSMHTDSDCKSVSLNRLEALPEHFKSSNISEQKE